MDISSTHQGNGRSPYEMKEHLLALRAGKASAEQQILIAKEMSPLLLLLKLMLWFALHTCEKDAKDFLDRDPRLDAAYVELMSLHDRIATLIDDQLNLSDRMIFGK